MKDLFTYLDSNKQSSSKVATGGEASGTLVDSSTGSPGLNKPATPVESNSLLLKNCKIFSFYDFFIKIRFMDWVFYFKLN